MLRKRKDSDKNISAIRNLAGPESIIFVVETARFASHEREAMRSAKLENATWKFHACSSGALDSVKPAKLKKALDHLADRNQRSTRSRSLAVIKVWELNR